MERLLTSETANTDDTDRLSLGDAVSDHGRVDGETGAEHGRRVLRLERVGDGKDKLVVGSDSSRVTSLRLDSIGELGVVSAARSVRTERDTLGLKTGRIPANSLDLLGAVVLIVILASVALQATVDLGADTDPLSNLELGDSVADMGDLADNLVTGANPVGRERSPSPSDGVDV
jgi:hypothetical protein